MKLFNAVAAPALEPSSVAVSAPGTALIEATGIVKRFGQTQALRGIDLSIAAGEVLAVMGPSGSGTRCCRCSCSGSCWPWGSWR